MKAQILQTLQQLRAYALEKGHEIALNYHEEDSYLMRFANSAVSLNTHEHLIRLNVTAYSGQKRASYSLITDLDQFDDMKRAVDTAAEMVEHSQPLTYVPTIPVFQEAFIDESGFDAGLATLSNQERLQFFNTAVEGLETADLKLSGIFSCGSNTLAMTNTRSEHSQYFRMADAQVTIVLAHGTLKWEVIAEQSAHREAELDPVALRKELALLVEHYTTGKPRQLPLGHYSIVFGPAATAEMLRFMNWIGFNGGLMKRGYSMLSEEQVGQKVLSGKLTLADDPDRPETFPFKRDFTGIQRERFPLFQDGVFQAFAWSQDDADEFDAQPTGHTVPHNSLVVAGGDQAVGSLPELLERPREEEVLYIPFLHYMNIVNPSKGIITASSRFGALYLNRDGSVDIPYNVRLTQSLLDIFGDKVEWLSSETVPYNASSSYGARNPTALVVPKFVKVRDLEISHSNASY